MKFFSFPFGTPVRLSLLIAVLAATGSVVQAQTSDQIRTLPANRMGIDAQPTDNHRVPEDATYKPTAEASAINTQNRRILDPHFKADTVDRQIVALAQLADINVFVDSTTLEENAPAYSLPRPASFWYILSNVAAMHDATWNTFDGKTYLFWRQPDLNDLTHRLVGGAKLRRAGPPVEDTALDAALQEYCRQQGWNGTTNNFNRRIRISMLPVALRRNVVSWAQEYLIARPDIPIRPHEIWFQDEPWTKSRLWIRNGMDSTGMKITFLWVEVKAERDGKVVALEQTGAGRLIGYKE